MPDVVTIAPMLTALPRTLRTLLRAGVLDPPLPRPSLLRLGARLPFLVPSLGAAVELHAATRPRATALVDDAGVLSWRALDRRVNRLANALLERAQRGDRVAFMVRNGREAVECYAACARAGLVAVPVNTWATSRELAAILQVQTPAVLVTEPEFAATVAATDLGAAALLETGAPYEDALAAASPRAPAVRGSALLVTHTSGTTGQPKGAERVIGLSGLEALVGFLDRVPLHRRDRFLVASPLFHAFGQGMAGVGFVLGATLVLTRRFSPRGFLDLAVRERVSAAAVVPLMLRRVLDARDPPPVGTLRVVVVSGSPLPRALRERAEGRFGRVFYDLYGSTEVGWAAISTPEDQQRNPDSVGRPARGMRVFAADESGRVLPPGEPGRLCVASDFAFEGYTGAQDRWSDLASVAGAIDTGDLGWVDGDGYVYVRGRADDVVVTGGENVHPSEVEAVLAEHPAVAEAAVAGVADEEYGQVLHAWVEPAQGAVVDAEALSAFLRERVARYKVPKRVEVVDALPRNAAGKVTKGDLTAGERRDTR